MRVLLWGGLVLLALGLTVSLPYLGGQLNSLADPAGPRIDNRPPLEGPAPVSFPGMVTPPPRASLAAVQASHAKTVALSSEIGRKVTAEAKSSAAGAADAYQITEVLPAYGEDDDVNGALVTLTFPGRGVDVEADWPVDGGVMHAKVIGLRSLGIVTDLRSGSVAEVYWFDWDTVEGVTPLASPPAGWVGD